MRITIAIITAIGMWLLAKRKGLNPWLWLLASGPPGFAILLCIPNARSAQDPDLRLRRKRSGDMLGTMLSAFCIMFALTLFSWTIDPQFGQFGGFARSWLYTGPVLQLLNLMFVLWLARLLRGYWRFLLVLAGMLSFIAMIPYFTLIHPAAPKWLKTAFHSDSGLFWHFFKDESYQILVGICTALQHGGVLLFSLLAYSKFKSETSSHSRRHWQLALWAAIAFLIPLAFSLGLGLYSYNFDNWRDTSPATIITLHLYLTWAVWQCVAAVLLSRLAHIAWWAVIVLVTPLAVVSIVGDCAEVFRIYWIQEHFMQTSSAWLPGIIRACLYWGIKVANLFGVCYAALHLPRIFEKAPSGGQESESEQIMDGNRE